MSASAIALKMLEERGQLQQPYGQRAFAILVPTAKPVCSLEVRGDASPAHTHKQA
jgi:hypothetical protein